MRQQREDESVHDYVVSTMREQREYLERWDMINLAGWLVVGGGTLLFLFCAGVWCSINGGC
jgi:hypothetical protein